MAQHRRQPNVAIRRSWQAGLVLALLGMLVVVVTPAQAAPERVLQSVDVRLGTDGSIETISSTAVRNGDDSDSAAETQDLDAAQTAGDLPVRILTSYRLDDQAGTDLQDISGRSGRVVIEVTVQNTTVEPERITYDAGGVQKSQYALVGVPLTVLASADLGEGSLGRIVTDTEGTGGQGAGAPVTNGVVSQSGDGLAQVQWASMLAPPRLAPSATFRLVVDTESFVPPSFDFSVQPGLVTDTSVTGLLQQAFSDDPTSTVSMEARTIELIGDVNVVLTEAGAVLSQIEQRLDGSAHDLGTQMIADLRTSSEHVTTSLGGLSGDLDRLSESMAAQFDGVRSDAATALQQSIASVKEKLGDPDSTKVPATPTTAGCEVKVGRDAASTTVYGQMVQVSSRLRLLSSAGQACRTSVAETLARQIGSADDIASCNRESTSALCVLNRARNRLTNEATQILASGNELADHFDDEALGNVSSRVAGVAAQVTAVQNLAEGLSLGTDGSEPSLGLLTELRDAVNTLSGELAGQRDDLIADLDHVNDVAQEQMSAIGAADDPETITGAVATLVDAVCDIPETPEDVAADSPFVVAVEEARAVAGCDADGVTLVDRLADVRAGWQETADRTQTDADSPVGKAFSTLTKRVDAISELLLALEQELGQVPGPGPGLSLREQIRQLNDLLSGLLTKPGAATPGPVNRLQAAADALVANQEGLGEQIDEVFADARSTLLDSGATVGVGMSTADQARRRADARVGSLFTTLNAGMDSAASRLTREGARRIREQRASLDREAAAAGLDLDGAVSSAIATIGTNIGAANRNLSDSESQLSADLQQVLIDLGTRAANGTGLLGSIAAGASQAAVSHQQVAGANERAAAFRGVRSQALDDVFLQQAQMTRSLERQQGFGTFGLDLPEGSTHLTVFSFHLGQG